jgi:NADPH:quinone reductase-like Zn-dependent oxidoreductase
VTQASKLVCLAPAQPIALAVEPIAMLQPRDGEVVVRVEACSVNPIDVKRASGYGRRLLGLKGAGKFPLVLGNDIAGVVESVGKGVTTRQPGDRVMGLVPTGKGGAHASHVAVDARWLQPAVDGMSAAELTAFPYTFTTLWQSLRQAGINQRNAKNLEVLVHGASGGMGQLAIQLLVSWGAVVTAICSTRNAETCRKLGAANVWDRQCQLLSGLPQRYDAVLNFANWEDEAMLIGSLKKGALAYATTVHTLLQNFDVHGWLLGAWRTRQDMHHGKALASAKGARYAWVIFKPEEEALEALRSLLSHGELVLPVRIAVPFSSAQQAFNHVAEQGQGRAVLLP